MPTALPEAVVTYLAQQGRAGGLIGGKADGDVKKRGSKAYYSRIGKLGAKAKARKAKKNFERAVKDYEAVHGKPKGARP